jgi:hypothetical protein
LIGRGDLDGLRHLCEYMSYVGEYVRGPVERLASMEKSWRRMFPDSRPQLVIVTNVYGVKEGRDCDFGEQVPG